MKKLMCLMLCAVLALCCACSEETTGSENNGQGGAEGSLPTQGEFIMPTVPQEPLCVEEAFTYTQEVTLKDSKLTEHSVRCPRLNVEGEGVEAFNQKLEASYRGVEALLKDGEAGEDIYVSDYMFAQKDGVIGLVLQHSKGNANGVLHHTYEVYYFDTNTGKELTAQEYMALLQVTAAEVLEEAELYGYLDITKEWALEWFVADYETAIIMVCSGEAQDDRYLTMVEYPQFLARQQAQENQE